MTFLLDRLHVLRQNIKPTDDAVLAAKAAAVVNDVMNVAFPAVTSVCIILASVVFMFVACRKMLINTNTSSTPKIDKIIC